MGLEPKPKKTSTWPAPLKEQEEEEEGHDKSMKNGSTATRETHYL
jgi:hypothetical protein